MGKLLFYRSFPIITKTALIDCAHFQFVEGMSDSQQFNFSVQKFTMRNISVYKNDFFFIQAEIKLEQIIEL